MWPPEILRENGKEIHFFHKIPNACSALKNFLGNEWSSFTQGLEVPDCCPIPLV